ncbi:MAG TPA: putative ABC exporter domain-containing protein [Lysobacter sp.]|nr:putative ABC exporter domain-containing protein [Lysobacter sp.]
MNASVHRYGAVFGAFAYLQATSLYNNVRQRLLRLRQPKYLIGAVVGVAYFYFFLFHRAVRGHGAPPPGFAMTPDIAWTISSLVALGLLLYVCADWIFGSEKAQLAYTEAEIDFLFPAPLTRTALIHFSLLRSQLAIFFSAFLIGLLLRRGGGFSGHPLQYITGFWLLMSTLKLHGIAAPFTRERLLGLGLQSWMRRVLAACVVVGIAIACAWSMRGVLHLPDPEAMADIGQLRQWFDGIVATAPLSWLLAPFHWVVGPMFATDTAAFLHALWPALAVLLLHYLWAVRAQVSFEDAAVVHARKRAERVAALREGRMGRRMPMKPRGEPFRLSGRGESWIAFLWKGLVAMGPLYRLRIWLAACVVVTVACQWLAADPARKGLLAAIGLAVPALGAWLLFLGPMMMQHGLRRTFERMDVLKALPLRGWQIALGELATPATVMCFAAWWLLLFAAQAIAFGHAAFTTAQVVAAALGMALLAPPLFGLMLCVPFAGMLVFPAWIVAPGSSGRGIEVMGQRMVFMLGYLLTVLLAALPAAVLGGLCFLLGNWLGGMAVAMLAAAVGASAVFAFELAVALRLLGRRIDRFDLSQELR